MKLFLISLLLMTAGWAQGQKYGHLNLGMLLATMPESHQIDNDLKVYTDKLNTDYNKMNKAFNDAVKAFKNDSQKGLLTSKRSQEIEADIQNKNEAILKFEQEANQKISNKREELVKPLMTRIKQAVKNVAKAKGFVMVFDSSDGAMLFADDAINILPLVKKDMGLSN